MIRHAFLRRWAAMLAAALLSYWGLLLSAPLLYAAWEEGGEAREEDLRHIALSARVVIVVNKNTHQSTLLRWGVVVGSWNSVFYGLEEEDEGLTEKEVDKGLPSGVYSVEHLEYCPVRNGQAAAHTSRRHTFAPCGEGNPLGSYMIGFGGGYSFYSTSRSTTAQDASSSWAGEAQGLIESADSDVYSAFFAIIAAAQLEEFEREVLDHMVAGQPKNIRAAVEDPEAARIVVGRFSQDLPVGCAFMWRQEGCI